MAFFKEEHKKLARFGQTALNEYYKHTEKELVNATKSGDEKSIKKAMKRHQLVEYALLYTNMPEFKNKQVRGEHNGKNVY